MYLYQGDLREVQHHLCKQQWQQNLKLVLFLNKLLLCLYDERLMYQYGQHLKPGTVFYKAMIL